ncbi:MAG: TetR/AcrR family transcriptional regulator [Bernardetiaceae bacterium]|nr:TetR/AcrR family transcriptional regulator [Bernardetiaceae bacterium]
MITTDKILNSLHIDTEKLEILKQIAALCMRYGVRSVTMDDMASHLGISKKTLYQHFKNKAEIISLVTHVQLDAERQLFEKAAAESPNAIQELITIIEISRNLMQSFHPSLLYDLKKYYPAAWKVYLHYKENVYYKIICQNIQRGIDDGIYRQDIDPRIFAKVRLELTQLAFDTDCFPREEFSVVEVQAQLLRHFITGMLSEKGAVQLKEKLIGLCPNAMQATQKKP